VIFYSPRQVFGVTYSDDLAVEDGLTELVLVGEQTWRKQDKFVELRVHEWQPVGAHRPRTVRALRGGFGGLDRVRRGMRSGCCVAEALGAAAVGMRYGGRI
jgi:hypothetical protein